MAFETVIKSEHVCQVFTRCVGESILAMSKPGATPKCLADRLVTGQLYSRNARVTQSISISTMQSEMDKITSCSCKRDNVIHDMLKYTSRI